MINSRRVSCTHSLKQNKNRDHPLLRMFLCIGAQLWVVKAKDGAFKFSVFLINKHEVAFSAEHFMLLTPSHSCCGLSSKGFNHFLSLSCPSNTSHKGHQSLKCLWEVFSLYSWLPIPTPNFQIQLQCHETVMKRHETHCRAISLQSS